MNIREMRVGRRTAVMGCMFSGALLMAILAASASGAKPKKNMAADPAVDPAADSSPANSAASLLDLNQLSLRVIAMDTLYEFDLSADQLRAIRGLSAGAASTAAREKLPLKADPKLAGSLKNLHVALTQGKDDEKISTLRNEVSEQVSLEVVPLDDDVIATSASRAQASAFCRLLKASQIAAYLAAHADQVADPQERMLSTVTELRDSETKDAAGIIQSAAADVGRLVAGSDETKVRAVADRAAAWLKSNQESTRGLKDEEFEQKRPALEESALKVIGDVSSMDVLNHWLENELAALLSNPQLPGALDDSLTARQ